MGYELSLLMGAAGLVLAVALVQVVVLVRLTRTAADITRMHDRLTRMVAALDLLTDTAETGFRQFAAHLEQRGTPASPQAGPVRRPEAHARARRAAASQGQASTAPAVASMPVRAPRKSAGRVSPPASTSAAQETTNPTARPTPAASARSQAAASPTSVLMVATRKASRTASTRRATATVAAFREAN